MLATVTLVLPGLAGGAAAQSAADTATVAVPATPPGASPAAGADSTAGRRAAGARPGAPARRGFFEQPRWVMMRSAVIPGWGQAHNGAWVKAAAIATGEGVLIARLIDDERALTRLDRQVRDARAAGDVAGGNATIERYNDRLDQTVRHEWLVAGLVTYAVLDAFVDAHFRDFKLEFENDKAPPGDATPGVRVSIGWGF